MRTNRDAGDEGSTLIETLVSLALVMVAMGAMGTFFVNSVLAVSGQRNSQAAVQLANTAMAQVRALKGSSLVSGHSFAKTDAQWCSVPFPLKPTDTVPSSPAGIVRRSATCAANAATPYLKTMQETWDPQIVDPASQVGDDATIPTSAQTLRADNVTFTQTIYVGACDIYVDVSPTCQPPADKTNPATPVSLARLAGTTRDLQYFRAVVLLTWQGRSCPAGTCSYVTSTLVSRATEPTFEFKQKAPKITTTSVTFYRGVPATLKLDVMYGTLPNTLSAPAAALPPGLTMDSTGKITGTPTTDGLTQVANGFTVTDSDARSSSATIPFTVVEPVALAGRTTSGHVGDTINQTALATGGTSPYKYAADDPAFPLPSWLTLDPNTGALTGTLTTLGTFTVKITATDANSTFDQPGSATATYVYSAYPAVTLAPIATQKINLGSAAGVTASASGGDGRFTYSASGLPTGVTMAAATGVLSGTPLVPGRYLPTVTVADGSGGTASARFALEVDTTSSLIFTSPGLGAPDQTSTVGQPVTLSLGSNATLLGLSPTLTITGLPPGLTLAPLTGVVTGTPTTAGSYVVSALVTSLIPPQTSVLTFLWTVS